MSKFYVISIIIRTITAMLVLGVGLSIWRIRKSDGPVVSAFAWAWMGLSIPLFWHILASFVYRSPDLKWISMIFWEYSFLPWSLCMITTFKLWRVLRVGQ